MLRSNFLYPLEVAINNIINDLPRIITLEKYRIPLVDRFIKTMRFYEIHLEFNLALIFWRTPSMSGAETEKTLKHSLQTSTLNEPNKIDTMGYEGEVAVQ